MTLPWQWATLTSPIAVANTIRLAPSAGGMVRRHPSMVLTAVLLAVVIAGCTSPGGAHPTPDLAPSPTVFTEVGVRLEKDGPSIYGEAMFSPCRGCSLPPVIVTGDLVLRRQGHSARRAALDAQGQFDVPVAVGTYSVSVFVTAPTAGMRPVCPAPIHVRVAAEEAIHAWFTCA